jgi:DnaJ-class molecular chaperone
VKKQIPIIAVVLFGLNYAPAALADWYDHYDHDRDHNWNWEEWRDARRHWEKVHHEEKRLSDEELRAEFDRFDHDHDHHLSREEAKAWGRW